MSTGKFIDCTDLHALLGSAEEFALLDVREQGIFCKEHILQANCVPLSHLELLIDDLVPHRNTTIIISDGGPPNSESMAQRAVARLSALGYTNLRILFGGTHSWREKGLMLFSGVNVPSKAFGEFVEHNYDTPRISATELHDRMARGERLRIVDSRPFTEYQRMSIPNGIDVPGAELVHRIFDLVPEPDVDVVVNCAGRTRSIIGAQSLINAGVSNRVMALKDGTMGWKLAGLELEHGQSHRADAPSAEGLRDAQQAAQRVAQRFNVRRIDNDRLSAWRNDNGRTLYILDVRTPEEFQAGHLPGSRPAPGGQLVQATDEYIATRNSRVVLVDDNGIRATMTASWLLQMGWSDVYVLDGGITGHALQNGEHIPNVLGLGPADLVTAADLKAALDSGESVQVMDLASSLEYRDRHIPGAWWSPRSRLDSALAVQPAVGLLVLTSPDGRLAQLAANDLSIVRPKQLVRVLEGGTQAWIEYGLPITSGLDGTTSATDDVWYKPYEHREAVADRMQEYLDWEVALVEQVEADGTMRFRYFE
ncbi:MAG: rhodanese-like domain-containing protein [Gammaproteobacteria bacterium]|nr:rhodanese-like domain-containing protein [Gammaproteobacteria bacterium]MDH3465770.1 rhodanese-like domain-containing protein [Gammaproteobacteria bacterium]